MTRLRMGMRSLKSLILGHCECRQWQNNAFYLPRSMVTWSQCFYSTTSSEQEKSKSKVVLRNKYKKAVSVVIHDNTKLSDIIRQCHLTDNIVTRALNNINWNVDPYAPIVYRDKRMLIQFLKELHISYIFHSSTKAQEKKVPKYIRPPPNAAAFIKRPPIITVMGHVDHGKTTLLDTLRKTSVAKSEEGGITQRIGVFNVKLGNNMSATVLDTPGHVAFNTMRERGAIVTDIIIMVVAADDGVMNQTEDTIRMATETNTPIIVAINKIDKPNADIELTQQMLAVSGVQVEQLGGDVQCIPISALKGTNLDKLIEAIELQTSILEPKGDPTGLVEGYIIETSAHPKLGKVATVLVQRGTLKPGAILLSSKTMTKVRFMLNNLGETVPKASLSEAVQISGWKELPQAGEKVLEVENLKIANMLLKQQVQEKASPAEKPEEQAVQENKEREYSIILKADSVGSMEAVTQLLNTYEEHDKCQLAIVYAGVGNITPNDINLAKTFNATIYCFNTVVPDNLKQKIEQDSVPLYSSNVIYTLVDNIKKELIKKYPMVDVEEITGEANVLQLYKYHERKIEVDIAGCMCTKGTIYRTGMYHIQRNGEIIDTGEIASLKHFKTDIVEVKKGIECGIKLSNKSIRLEIGDTVICFKKHRKMAECHWKPGGEDY